MAAGLRRAIDHELAARSSAAAVPQLELLVADIAGVCDGDQACEIDHLALRGAGKAIDGNRWRPYWHRNLPLPDPRPIFLLKLGPQRVRAAGGADIEHGVGEVGWRDVDLMAAGLRCAID